jgi:hypothetical protein
MMPGFFLKKWLVLIFIIGAISCGKGNNKPAPVNNPLQYKWTLVSRTATFPASPRNNFVEKDFPNDYLSFGKNDTVYSYVTSYLPFSIDTVFYKESANSITFYVSTMQNGFIFQSQDTNGNLHDTTVAQIISLTSSTLVLGFPTIGTVTNLAGPGITTYYPGTEIDSLTR